MTDEQRQQIIEIVKKHGYHGVLKVLEDDAAQYNLQPASLFLRGARVAIEALKEEE